MDTFHPFWTLFQKHSFQPFSTLNIVYCVASVPKMKMEIYDLLFLERLTYIAAADIFLS